MNLSHDLGDHHFIIGHGAPVTAGFTFTGDYQHVRNPVYNRDRGPVSVFSIRIHWEAALRR